MPNAATLKIIAQIIGFCGTIIVVIGMQQKKYKHIVMCKKIGRASCRERV